MEQIRSDLDEHGTFNGEANNQASGWQKQINSMPYFYPAEYTNLVWSVYILLAILQFCRRMSGFGTPFLSSVQHRQRPEEASTHDIYPQYRNEITKKLCACSLLH